MFQRILICPNLYQWWIRDSAYPEANFWMRYYSISLYNDYRFNSLLKNKIKIHARTQMPTFKSNSTISPHVSFTPVGGGEGRTAGSYTPKNPNKWTSLNLKEKLAITKALVSKVLIDPNIIQSNLGKSKTSINRRFFCFPEHSYKLPINK